MKVGMKVGIVGLGLIGGSMALDMKASGQYQLYGVSRRPETCRQAVEWGVVQEASTNFALLADMQMVILCTPLGVMEETVQRLLPHLNPDTVLTDVGSVKRAVVDALAPLWPNFVGGHPMAGTADSGLAAAQRHLFVDCAYVLTPVPSTPALAVERVTHLAQVLGSRVYHCTPDEHDRAVAWISHLPVMVSASLIAACLHEADVGVVKLAKTLASSGFRDTSRVGGGNPELGRMMATYNREALLRSLYGYRHQLDQVIDLIERSQWEELEQRLGQTQASRPEFT